uniref:Uncharacterized protein n=1 Tax=Bursaphelenchus xylophilus TaxID=6326 RepID=A0A1I7RYS3_BURXY
MVVGCGSGAGTLFLLNPGTDSDPSLDLGLLEEKQRNDSVGDLAVDSEPDRSTDLSNSADWDSDYYPRTCWLMRPIRLLQNHSQPKLCIFCG